MKTDLTHITPALPPRIRAPSGPCLGSIMIRITIITIIMIIVIIVIVKYVVNKY